ncbi:hypothetical protein AB1Y20_003467 [Prymnesium parvum]|uniref:ATP-dependent transporter ycf16 n=1 Tax=Prymnesium parvum TaxID=97485 RepID=A0AB34JDM5_PRYPA
MSLREALLPSARPPPPPAAAAVRPAPPLPTWRLLLRLSSPASPRECLFVLLSLSLLLGAKLLLLALPLLLRQAVDTLAAGGGFGEAAPFVLGYALLRLLADGCSQLQEAAWARFFYQISRRAALALLEHLHALSLEWHLARQTGELLGVVSQGVGAVGNLVQTAAFQIGAALLELALTAAVFSRVGVPAISLCVLAGAAAYSAYTVLLIQRRTPQRRACNAASHAAQQLLVESLLNFESVKLHTCEAAEAARFGGLARELVRLQLASQDSLSCLNWGQSAAVQLGMGAGLLVACARAASRLLSVGDFVMVQLYIAQLFVPLANLGSNYRMMVQSLTDVEKMAQLLRLPVQLADTPHAADLRQLVHATPHAARDVAFDDVSFRYASSAAGVRRLSFRIPPGGSVGLAGPSGGGKSTCTRLLCRLVDPHAGAVRVCGYDLRDVTQHSVRRVVACVAQETVLFDASVRFNLTYGAAAPTEEQIAAACAEARVDAFVGGLPHGYDTLVGERGLRLSGGEKQRLGLARALVRSPAVLVLDEATAALDADTERMVQRALDRAKRGRCTLSIAHRLSTIVKSDEILVLKAGEVVERGSHEELLQQPGGLYASMWAIQSEADRHTKPPPPPAPPLAPTYDPPSPPLARPTLFASHSWHSLALLCANLPAASRAYSRAYTLHAAMCRLGLLAPPAAASPPAAVPAVLRIHVLGADQREGSSFSETCRFFAPLCALLAGSHWKEVSLLLCGPNCVVPPAESQLVKESIPGGAAGLRLAYSTQMYHQLSENERGPAPHLAAAFQAGLWGYDSWAPTVALVRAVGCPLLVTSYNLPEAEDDEEALAAAGVESGWRWAPEANPWGSLEDERALRAQTGAGGEGLYENGVWQCV